MFSVIYYYSYKWSQPVVVLGDSTTDCCRAACEWCGRKAWKLSGGDMWLLRPSRCSMVQDRWGSGRLVMEEGLKSFLAGTCGRSGPHGALWCRTGEVQGGWCRKRAWNPSGEFMCLPRALWCSMTQDRWGSGRVVNMREEGVKALWRSHVADQAITVLYGRGQVRLESGGRRAWRLSGRDMWLTWLSVLFDSGQVSSWEALGWWAKRASRPSDRVHVAAQTYCFLW